MLSHVSAIRWDDQIERAGVMTQLIHGIENMLSTGRTRNRRATTLRNRRKECER